VGTSLVRRTEPGYGSWVRPSSEKRIYGVCIRAREWVRGTARQESGCGTNLEIRGKRTASAGVCKTRMTSDAYHLSRQRNGHGLDSRGACSMSTISMNRSGEDSGPGSKRRGPCDAERRTTYGYRHECAMQRSRKRIRVRPQIERYMYLGTGKIGQDR